MKNYIAIILIIFTFINCDKCEPNEKDCDGDVLQICNDGQWADQNCSDILDIADIDGPSWTCCFSDEIDDYECNRKEECK